MINIPNHPILIALATIGAVFAGLRIAWGWMAPLRSWIRHQLTTTVEVQDPEVHRWLSEWFARSPAGRRSRNLAALAIERDVIFTPGEGNHFFLYGAYPIWMEREVKHGTPNSWSSSSIVDQFKVTTPGRDSSVARRLLREAAEQYFNRRNDRLIIHFTSGDYWEEGSTITPRPIETVIAPGVVDRVVSDLQQFLDNRSWYESVGVPYRRGYLFHGPPGSGKTSLAKALASHFGLDMYLISLSSWKMSDERMASLLNRAERGIVVIEDIDAAFHNGGAATTKAPAPRKAGRERATVSTRDRGDVHQGLTFSGLLNAIDGIASQDGRILIMTTNNRAVLDEALTRAGRIDVEAHMGSATGEQARMMFLRFFPDQERLASFFGDHIPTDISMAEIQNHLIHYRDNPPEASKNPVERSSWSNEEQE